MDQPPQGPPDPTRPAPVADVRSNAPLGPFAQADWLPLVFRGLFGALIGAIAGVVPTACLRIPPWGGATLGAIIGTFVGVVTSLQASARRRGRAFLRVSPLDALGRLVGRHRRTIWVEGPAHARALLGEALAEFPRERAWLGEALERGVVAGLVDGSAGPRGLEAEQALVEEAGMTAGAAAWTVDAWAVALGLLPAAAARLSPFDSGWSGRRPLPPRECGTRDAECGIQTEAGGARPEPPRQPSAAPVGPAAFRVPHSALAPRLVCPSRAAVVAMAVSPEGRYALTGATDGAARLWDLVSGLEVRRFAGFAEELHGVALSPDGRLALGGGGRPWQGRSLATGTARVWEVASGQELLRIEVEGAVWAVAFSPDGADVLLGGHNAMWLWDVETGKRRALFPHAGFFAQDEVRAVAFSPNGRWAVSGCNASQNARLWDLERGEELATLKGHGLRLRLFRPGAVVSVAFTGEGQRVVTGSWDKTARVWSLIEGRELVRFEGHRGLWGWRGVTGVAVLPDDRHVLSGSEDGTVRVWELETGREKARFEHGARVNAVACTPDGRWALSAGSDGVVRTWLVG